jgi:hypothetical protein
MFKLAYLSSGILADLKRLISSEELQVLRGLNGFISLHMEAKRVNKYDIKTQGDI